MWAVTQRYEGWPNGECVSAAYSSLLEIPIEKIPRFDPAVLGSEDQRDAERRWLASLKLPNAPRGFTLVEITSDPDELPAAILGMITPGLHLISGISPRKLGHRCVGYGGRVVWDPHPSRAGLEKIYSIGLLVPR